MTTLQEIYRFLAINSSTIHIARYIRMMRLRPDLKPMALKGIGREFTRFNLI